MAADSVVDGDYLGAYSRFFAEFVARVNPRDQLPVKVSAYDVNESELVGEIIRVTLQYLNQAECPPSLQSYIVHLVIQAIKSTCKKQPEVCGLRQQEKTYAPLKLMQAVTNEVNEICRRYLDNSRLALLPPPSSTPQVSMGATRNIRRKMEDRHVVLHDLHTMFNIQDNTIANYYAVFDGHGGQDAAAYCATHLHRYLVESVHYPTDPESALRDAFLTTDAQFIAKSSTQKLNGGTTAVCALLLNKKLYIAWVGDSMASLVTRNQVKQLVNPHRPTREDETKRIIDLGGVVVHCMGVLRVNGLLSISRAIGDVSYKPYISGEPEVRCVSLKGNEDFLIIACDGLWDYVDQKSAAQLVYQQVLKNPHDLKYVQQALLHSAKYAGSLDNITVIVAFLTPPIEIALRHQPLTHQAPNGLLLNNIRMDPNSSISLDSSDSDPGDYKNINSMLFDLNSDRSDFALDATAICFGDVTRNGKIMDQIGRDEDDDYVDLGPETDVDAADDPPLAASSRGPTPGGEKLPERIKEYNRDNRDNDPKDDDVAVMDSDVDDRVGPSDSNIRSTDDNMTRDTAATLDSTASAATEDDELSSLPQADRTPPQDVSLPEEENVAESEDSEGEWKYYRTDPNKEEKSVTANTTADESREKTEEQSVEEEEKSESVKNDSSEIVSSKVQSSEGDIKCEGLVKSLADLAISTDTSEEGKRSESEQSYVLLEAEKTEEDNKGDMDFQLNPEAAEFVPSSSSPLLGNKEFLQDYPISGSPLKQTPAMDDISVPSQIEFEKEVCHRPREIDEPFSNDEQQHADRVMADSQRDNACDMDESEASSTKAEMGDDSMIGTMSSTQWQTDVSAQWGGKTRDDSEGCNLNEYEIVNKSDLMTVSYSGDSKETVSEKSVDLNAVHDLNESSDGAENADAPPRSPEPFASEERACTTPSEDKSDIDPLCVSSTPHPSDEKLISTATSNSDTTKDTYSTFQADSASVVLREVSDLVAPIGHVTEPTTSSEPKSTFDESEPIPDEFEDDEAIPNTIEEVSGSNNKLQTGQIDDDKQSIENRSEADEKHEPSSECLLDNSLPEINLEEKKIFDEVSRPEDVIEMMNLEKSGNEEESPFDPIWNKLEAQFKERQEFAEKTAMSCASAWQLPVTVKPTIDEDLVAKACSEAQERLLNDKTVIPDQFFRGPIDLGIEHSDPYQYTSWTHSYKDDRPLLPSKENYPKLNCLEMDQFEQEVEDRKATVAAAPAASKGPSDREDDDPEFLRFLNSNVKTEREEGIKEDIAEGGDVIITSAEITEAFDTIKRNPQIPIEAEGNMEGTLTASSLIDAIIEHQIAMNHISVTPITTTATTTTAATITAATTTATITTTTVSLPKTKTGTIMTTMATTTTAKRPKTVTKTTTSPTSKTATKSPTSPSKTISTMRATTLQSAAKKPIESTAARPKQLDGSVKAMVPSGGTKQIAAKTTTTTSKTTTTTTAAPKVSVSPRYGMTKPKTLASTKLSGASTEKKLTTTTDDTKPVSRSVTAKPPVPKTTTSGAITKATLVKAPLTITKPSVPSATSKPRPTSSGSTVKTPTSTLKQPSTGQPTTGLSRPRTAPSSGATKLRENVSRAAPVKSPLGDKQTKETANKQVSRSGVSKVSGRGSAPASGVTGTAITPKPRLSLGKSSALSPTKKSSSTPKATSRTGAETKNISSSETKQNGVPQTMKETDNKIIERLSGSEDEIPQKDTSPVNVSSDNQLVVD